MPWELATIDRDKTTGQTAILGVGEVDAEQLRSHQEHRRQMLDLIADDRLMKLVRANYREYGETAAGLLATYKAEGVRSLHFEEEIAIELNRRILNLLSTVRVFLDHAETRLSHRYGNGSVELAGFKAVCSRAYDECFAYRFLYSLRNHAQHYGLPAENVRFGEGADDTDPEETRYFLDVSFKRDELLANEAGWKPSLRDELREQPELIDVPSNLAQMMSELERIQQYIASLRLHTIASVLREVGTLVTPLRGRKGYPCLIRVEAAAGVPSSIEVEWIPVDLLVSLVNDLTEKQLNEVGAVEVADYIRIS